jgi:predicted phosphate transport protein (TIGR00153 family)
MWFHKRHDFHKLLLDQSRATERGLQLLYQFLQHPGSELGGRVEKAEEAADTLRQDLIRALNKSFITPFDREDIFDLSRAIDDMIDYAKSTVEEMVLFEVKTDEHLKKMGEALYQAARYITMAVEGLRDMNGHLSENIVNAKKTENLMEHLYREALADLFRAKDMAAILKLREIYRHMSNAADRGDEAANILSDIQMKNT